jgi:hypothetical protein
MIKFLVFGFLWIGQFLYGQVPDSITKIILNYSKGHNSWDEPGVYATTEQLEYTKISSEYFEQNKYINIKYSVDTLNKIYLKDTINFHSNSNSLVETNRMNNIINQLFTPKDNYTFTFIRPRLKSVNKNYIYKIVKNYDELWQLKGKDAYRADTKLFIKEIKNFNNLDSFLYVTKPDTQNYLVVIDVWNVLKIELITARDTTIFQAQFHHAPLGQPICRYHSRQSDDKLFVNLEVNTSIQEILPKKSLLFDILDMNSIKEDYIMWYLDRYF